MFCNLPFVRLSCLFRMAVNIKNVITPSYYYGVFLIRCVPILFFRNDQKMLVFFTTQLFLTVFFYIIGHSRKKSRAALTGIYRKRLRVNRSKSSNRPLSRNFFLILAGIIDSLPDKLMSKKTGLFEVVQHGRRSGAILPIIEYFISNR